MPQLVDRPANIVVVLHKRLDNIRDVDVSSGLCEPVEDKRHVGVVCSPCRRVRRARSSRRSCGGSGCTSCCWPPSSLDLQGRAVRLGNWKLISMDKKTWQLYDMNKDPYEAKDLSAQYPERVQELKQKYENWSNK